MLYDLNKPSDNMNLSYADIQKMTYEQMSSIYDDEKDSIMREQAETERAMTDYASYVNEYVTSQANSVNNRMAFLENVKTGFLSAAMHRVLVESMNSKVTESDKNFMKNLIVKFITEQNASTLLGKFKYKNTFVAEMGSIVNKAYRAVVESITDPENPTAKPADLKLDVTIVDDFYKDLVNLDTVEVSKIIRDKVSDAMNDFIDQNMQSKIDYQEVIDTAKEKMAAATEESAIEEIKTEMNRQINEMRRTKPKNAYHYMFESMIKGVLKDDTLKAKFVHESSIDTSAIEHNTEIIYTMLEMLNTTEIVEEEYIRDYITSLAEV